MHSSAYILRGRSDSNMIGDTNPNGTCTSVNVDRIPRFVVSVDLSGKTRLNVSSLFLGSPRSLLSLLVVLVVVQRMILHRHCVHSVLAVPRWNSTCADPTVCL